MINKVSSVAPGVKKYIDIAKISNNMSVDVDKITFYIVFRPNLFVILFSFSSKFFKKISSKILEIINFFHSMFQSSFSLIFL